MHVFLISIWYLCHLLCS